MMARLRSTVSFTLSLLVCASVAYAEPGDAKGDAKGDVKGHVQFNRDVRPILAEHCWQCHGPDAASREADLRLDLREAAVAEPSADEKDVAAAIVAGHPDRSEVIRRIRSREEDRMPPDELGKPLTQPQIEVLTRWVEQGAPYETHWSFQPIARPAVPTLAANSKVRSPIDAFVEAQLHRHQRSLAPAADADILLRRVTLALTGLPPTLSELDAEESYEQAVDRLFASPHFGEHLAVGWLDAARYADTNGYFGDKPRTMWPWRDWVIDALNRGQPFDQFTIEQLAGDMLPDATLRQRIATGFNRNHMANNETGIIDEEFRTAYVVDRVDTTMTTWMGMTAGCSQCHDHKYDPITQREFYQLFAYFNNVPEKGLITSDDPPPRITVATVAQQARLARLKAIATAASQKFASMRDALDKGLANWESQLVDSLPSVADTEVDESVVFSERFDGRLTGAAVQSGEFSFVDGIVGKAAKFDATQHAESAVKGFEVDTPWTIGFWIKPDGTLSCILSKVEPTTRRRGLEVLLQKGKITLHLIEHWGVRAVVVSTAATLGSRQWRHVVISHDGSLAAKGLRIWIDGQAAELSVKLDTVSGSVANQQPLQIGRRDSGLGYYGELDDLKILSRSVQAAEAASWHRNRRLQSILSKPSSKRSARERDFLVEDFMASAATPEIRDAWRAKNVANRELQRYQKSIPTALVMEELPKPRQAHILLRGQYDQLGEPVSPGVPAALSNLKSKQPKNRMEFAQWVVSPDNPLTARVAANRLWKLCFGEGLVRTMNDFGTQGEPPTHPELLDWLAAELIENQWDIKRLLREIVLSQTFRQGAATVGDPNWDPENRLLSRGPSFRLSAEVVRDQALAAAGLLQREIGGPSVKPYQPEGLWKAVSYNGDTAYQQDRGAALWRRSLYTYIKRQAPPPTMLAFDATTRESCVVRRSKTSTPLQALILLNDPTYVEAARALAARSLSDDGDVNEKLKRLFRRVLSRSPRQAETQALSQLLSRQRNRFRSVPAAARDLTAVGESTAGHELNPTELAAWTVVAHTVLILQEAIHLP